MKTILDNDEMNLVRDLLRIVLNNTITAGGRTTLDLSTQEEAELIRAAEELNLKLV